MKAIFLDFDGVLSANPIKCNFDLVPQLNVIHEQTGAGIVFSTSWRLSHDVGELTTILRAAGLSPDVPMLGTTPILQDVNGERRVIVCSSRWNEIAAWLADHPKVTDYCVIDDIIDADCPIERAVECRWGHGLNDERTECAIEILGSKQ